MDILTADVGGLIGGLTKSSTKLIMVIKGQTPVIYDADYDGSGTIDTVREVTFTNPPAGFTFRTCIAYFPNGKLFIGSTHRGVVCDYDETNGTLTNLVQTEYGNDGDGNTITNVFGAYALSNTKIMLMRNMGGFFTMDVSSAGALSNFAQLKSDLPDAESVSDRGGITKIGDRFLVSSPNDYLYDYVFSENGNLLNFRRREGVESRHRTSRRPCGRRARPGLDKTNRNGDCVGRRQGRRRTPP